MLGTLMLFLRRLDPEAWDAGRLLSSPGPVSAPRPPSPAPSRDRSDNVSHCSEPAAPGREGPTAGRHSPSPCC